MNERIQKIAKQATTKISFRLDPTTYKHIDDPAGDFERVEFDKQKFAELIVRECINSVIANGNSQSAADYDRGYIDGQSFSLKCIKKHFGVEE